jgi:hypothetical protein
MCGYNASLPRGFHSQGHEAATLPLVPYLRDSGLVYNVPPLAFNEIDTITDAKIVVVPI